MRSRKARALARVVRRLLTGLAPAVLAGQHGSNNGGQAPPRSGVCGPLGWSAGPVSQTETVKLLPPIGGYSQGHTNPSQYVSTANRRHDGRRSGEEPGPLG